MTSPSAKNRSSDRPSGQKTNAQPEQESDRSSSQKVEALVEQVNSTPTEQRIGAQSNQKNDSQPTEPLIIWVSGGKGGVGKTTTARILTDLLSEETDDLYGYDCDPVNPQFKRFYGADYLPLTSPDRKTADIAAETLAERIENKQHKFIIIDSPAGEIDMLGQLEERFAFISNLQHMNARLTRVLVMSTTLESVNLLEKAISNARGLPVAHIAIRNLHFGGPHYFDAYNRSPVKTELERQGGITIDFPELGAITTDSIDKQSLTYSEAIEKESGLPTMRRSMIYQWRNNVRDEFAKAGHLLGLGL